MGQLVDVLMGADLSGMVSGGSQIATMPAAAPAEEVVPAEETAAEPEPEPGRPRFARRSVSIPASR